MSTYTTAEMIALAYYAGFRGTEIDNIVAIAHQESGYNTAAKNVNTDGSVDRGLFQINNVYHPNVSDTCAYNAVCSAQAAYAISHPTRTNGDKHADFGAWDSSVDGWRGIVPSIKKVRTGTDWQQYTGQFAGGGQGQRGQGRGPHGQGDDTANGAGGGTGTADNGATASAIAAAQNKQGRMLFHCDLKVQTTAWVVPTGVSGLGCYIKDGLEAFALAFGGLALMAVGGILFVNSNKTLKQAGSQVKGAAIQTAGLVAAPETGGASEAGALAASREARLATNSQLAQSREARVTARQAELQPVAKSRARAQASHERAKAAALREETRGKAAKRKGGAAYTGDLPDSILGYKFDPSKIVPDPTRMAG